MRLTKETIRQTQRAFCAWWRHLVPRTLDDAQRVVLGTLGGGLILGGIAWAGTVNAALPLRALPAALMFVVGGMLLIVALRGRGKGERFWTKRLLTATLSCG